MLSVVIPTFNESKNIRNLVTQIDDALKGIDYEIVFIDDSKDNTPDVINEVAKDFPAVRMEHRTNGTGLATAVLRGFKIAKGEYLACMDADLQHPVECIPQILDTFNQGYEVISMVRTANKSAGFVKNLTSGLFYKILNKISEVHFEENASDFFAITKKPAEVLKKHFRETSRFLRAYVQSIGFKKTTIEYEAHDRAAGESKYSIKGLFKFSVQAMLSYSDLPLKIASLCGTFAGIACVLLIIYSIYMKIRVGAPGGYTTTVVVICFMFTVLFFLLGIIGEYLAVILSEIRKRPIYLVRDAVNFEKDQEKENEDI